MSYLVVVEDFAEVIVFKIDKTVPVENHYKEIKMYMSKDYSEFNYIITFIDKNIRIS